MPIYCNALPVFRSFQYRAYELRHILFGRRRHRLKHSSVLLTWFLAEHIAELLVFSVLMSNLWHIFPFRSSSRAYVSRFPM